MSKKVISYCLWGQCKVYNYGALHNALAAKEHYPDFEVWIYFSYREECIPEIIDILQSLDNVKMIEIGKDNYIPCGANDVWRFFAAFDPSVDIYICRDLDSHLDNPRDLYATKEWLESKETFHIIRDHPDHYKYVIVCCGFGCKQGVMRPFEDDLRLFYQAIIKNNYSMVKSKVGKKVWDFYLGGQESRGRSLDQWFLKNYVYNNLSSIMSHFSQDSYKNLHDNSLTKRRYIKSSKIEKNELIKIIPADIKGGPIGRITTNMPLASKYLNIKDSKNSRFWTYK